MLLLQVEVLHVSNDLMIVNKIQTELSRLTTFVLAEDVISNDLKIVLNYRNVKNDSKRLLVNNSIYVVYNMVSPIEENTTFKF